ncbi:hypothetical protein CPY51_25870 [Rhizobium tubonense]|uniref:Uncharacterized protein n=1 Tax=Rhizobium tubonense TaxID=484088 RepID=A0A2W4EC85_9HYPH|nr:hypothetical protein CPY51_25870 [Rhizobium tubonense]
MTIATKANNQFLRNFAVDFKLYFGRNRCIRTGRTIDNLIVGAELATPNPLEGCFRIILQEKQRTDSVNRRFR